MQNPKTIAKQLDQYYELFREMTVMYEEWAKGKGLSGNSVLVLSAIFEYKDACTQKIISDKWSLPKQTVNSILKEFERKGLIRLIQSPDDKRSKFIHLTKTGARQAENIVSKLRELEMGVLKGMGHEQVDQMNGGMACFVSLFRKGASEKND